MRKGQKRPIEILRLPVGGALTAEHIDALRMAIKLKQNVTAKVNGLSLVVEVVQS